MKPARWNWSPGMLEPAFQQISVGLRGLWPMWEGGGKEARNLMDTNHGTLVQSSGFPAFGATMRGVGIQNQSGNGYIDVANFAPASLNAITCLGVVRVGFAGISTSHVVSKHPDWFLSGDGTTNKLRFAVTTSGGTFSTAGYPLNFGAAMGFVGCYDRKTVQLYAEGTLVSSVAETRAMTNTGTLRLIGYAGGGLQWFGEVVMCAIWHGIALSPAQCALVSRDPFGLIRRWNRRAAIRFQYHRPTTDISDGSWLNEAASNVNLYQSVDEPDPAVDSDWNQSATAPTADTMEQKVSNPGTPNPGAVSIHIRGKRIP